MTTRSYLDLLRVPGFASLMGYSLVARLPLGMTGLAVVLLVTEHGAYSRAGLVVAAYVAGTGIAGPILGRMVDRVGRTKILPPFAAVEAVLLCVLAELSPQDTAALLGFAFAAGLCTPPVTSSAGLCGRSSCLLLRSPSSTPWRPPCRSWRSSWGLPWLP